MNTGATQNNDVVLDLGSGTTLAGWSSQSIPQETFASAVGRPIIRRKETKRGQAKNLGDLFIGNEAVENRSFCDISYPIKNGLLQDLDDVYHICNYAFEKLGVKHHNTNILLTEQVQNPKKNRERQAELMFEKFGFNGLQIQIQALLSTFSEGKKTSCVLDSGDGVSYVIPISDGYIIRNIISKIYLGGRAITDYLTRLLFLSGYAFNSTADYETVKAIKEKLCFVSHNLEVDRKLVKETVFFEEDYRLPDGQLVRLGSQRFEATEIIFNPRIGGYELEGLGEMVFNSIKRADADIRPQLYGSILLTGGTTMLPGFSDRLQNDMMKSFQTHISKRSDSDLRMRIKIDAPARRKFNVFTGGGIFCEVINNKKDTWITNKEWQEHGIQILHKKVMDKLQSKY